MKKSVFPVAALMAFSFMIMGTAVAQDGEKDKDKEKSKSKSKLDDYEEIIIKKKTNVDTKVTVEIKDGEVKVDGKPLDDYESEAISIRRRKPAVITYGRATSPFSAGNVTINGDADWYGLDSNRAFLGISSQDSPDGVKILQVTDESAAEKAGLKSGDIIVKIDEVKIEDPEDVTSTIRKHKPNDKITITYKRSDKEAKTTATLGKTKNTYYQSFNFNNDVHPEVRAFKSMENFRFDPPGAPTMAFSTNRQRIGIRAQDTEDSKGAKVLDVSSESAAEKAGIREGDIITSFDGKKITNADELSAAAREAKDKTDMEVKYNRAGKALTAQIKIPKKLKTTSL